MMAAAICRDWRGSKASTCTTSSRIAEVADVAVHCQRRPAIGCVSLIDRASALHVYHTCVTTLQREMGVDPDPATREAYEQLMQHETPVIPAIVHQPLRR
jgi:hypothetical protein